jgi:beta-xylosidase
MPALSRRTPRTVALLLAALLVSSLVAAGLGAGAQAAVGSDDFRAGEVYRGDFPDPSVMRVGDTYYSFSTNTGGKLLPAMTSKDLVTWRARYSNTGKWWQNDALAKTPPWAKRHYANGKWRVTTWAPSAARIGGRYVVAYVAPVQLNPRKMCISLAYSDKPLGLYKDTSTRPFVCAKDQGSIDPDIYVGPHGSRWLLWKNEGIKHREPTRIWVRRLNTDATGFARGSRPRLLLTTAKPWEGNIIENPSMVFYGNHTYLFYSANRYQTTSYAIGYAVCDGATGPCHRPGSTPLLASGGRVDGPGGPDAFVGQDGQLRMAYAAWDRGRVGYPKTAGCKSTPAGCPQRKLHVATLGLVADRLVVLDRG